MEWTTLPARNPPRKSHPLRVSSTARELDFASVAVSHPPENIPVLLSMKRMVRFSCAVMETGSDGWLTTRLISSLPAERKMGGRGTSSTQTCLPGIFRGKLFNWSDSRRGRTVLGLRLQRRDALLRVQVVEQRLAAVERHHHLVGVGGHESH